MNSLKYLGKGITSLPQDIKTMITPLEIFNYFFTDEVVQVIVDETNRAATGTGFETSVIEIRRFIGVLMYMSVYRYPNLRSYWGKNAFTPIQTTMPINKFKQITQFLSFQDESQRQNKGQPGYDPLFRIRNVIFSSENCSPLHRRANVQYQNKTPPTPIYAEQAAQMGHKTFRSVRFTWSCIQIRNI